MGVGGLTHSPNVFVSENPNVPLEECTVIPFTRMSYQPSPKSQQKPSPVESIIVNSYSLIGRHISGVEKLPC